MAPAAVKAMRPAEQPRKCALAFDAVIIARRPASVKRFARQFTFFTAILHDRSFRPSNFELDVTAP